jgi:gluconokinase
LEYIIAVDIGTTSAKALAVSAKGEVVASHHQFYTTHYSPKGFAEQDAEKIYQAVLHIISETHQQISQHTILGISLSAAMHSIMAVDSKGNPITPMIIWADTRSAGQAEKIKSAGLGSKLLQITGTPVHPMSPLCKLIWWKDNQPETIQKAHKLVSIKEFIVHRLTGEYLIDHSTASATGLFDIEKLEWSEEARELHGVDYAKFSTPVSVYHTVDLETKIALSLGFKEKIKLILGASDGCSAQLGSGASLHGDVSLTLGTSGAVRVVSAKRLLDRQDRLFNYLLDEKTFVCGGATNNGTALLSWFCHQYPQSATDISEFVKQTNDVAAGSDGLLMLPFLLGERAPIYDAKAKGAYIGVSINHTHLHFQRALLEGICFELKSILKAVEENIGKPKRILVSGGITRSQEWLQLLSTILQRELLVAEQPDASAMGAAIIGFKSLGIEWKFEKLNTKTFSPDVSLQQIYEKQFLIFEKLYEKLKDVFHELNTL